MSNSPEEQQPQLQNYSTPQKFMYSPPLPQVRVPARATDSFHFKPISPSPSNSSPSGLYGHNNKASHKSRHPQSFDASKMAQHYLQSSPSIISGKHQLDLSFTNSSRALSIPTSAFWSVSLARCRIPKWQITRLLCTTASFIRAWIRENHWTAYCKQQRYFFQNYISYFRDTLILSMLLSCMYHN